MNTSEPFLAKRIEISGIVQGVGFRPFIYRKAKEYELKGEVSNSSHGVDIVIEGEKDIINKFCKNLTKNLPPLSIINEIKFYIISISGFNKFSIVKSSNKDEKTAIISPDVSVCIDCLDEIDNFKNRRYRYPFTNCTNCGPRYTITSDIPYDRNKTSMNEFTMCPLCQAEYNDPMNRRFHAQPNACSICGPRLILTNHKGDELNSKEPIILISYFLREGHIVAIKGLGGFHLVVDATNELAVKKLRQKKHRKDKPFAIMSANINCINSYADINKDEKILLTGVQKPIVLLKKKNNSLIVSSVSPNNKYIGVMLPYTPLHHLLLTEGFVALVMTSGNLSGESIVIDNEKAVKKLGNIADFFLMHNRTILVRNDDSIFKYYAGSSKVIRRSRGYVPIPIKLVSKIPSILACGAEMKNTVCLTRNTNAFISQHIGDLKSGSAYDFFRTTINHMKHILNVNPKIVACDYHPDYVSTRYAFKYNSKKVIQVQHHHAHIVACMVENRVKDPVIGLAFDGTGIGIDNTIWGSEVLIADYFSFERVACLETVPMPGGTIAIQEPWRMAVSYLYEVFGDSLLDLNLPIFKSIDKDSIKVLITMIQNKINTPNTSSLGRFFDGIAAILGVRNKISFEGQAAIEFEALADNNVKEKYNFIIDEKYNLLLAPIVNGIVIDSNSNISIKIIAAKFHNTIIEMFCQTCLILKQNYGIRRVALSGGVFQNTLLLYGFKMSLEKKGFEVLTHNVVPFNDGSISLGQAVVASYLV